ncbi:MULTISPECIES: DUF3313 family protein [unclassified Sinorhizobium]|uniref:DUF3313 family protein n=1 Tax=unclassified Sinorhizobium TaxID=2613772 RepID=UPI0035240DE2
MVGVEPTAKSVVSGSVAPIEPPGRDLPQASYAVEVYDAMSNHLLLAYVFKQYPNAMNIGASFGSMAAARVGVRKGAEDLLAQIQ